VASLSQGRTAAAQCGLFTHKSVPVIFEPPCIYFNTQQILFNTILFYFARGDMFRLLLQPSSGQLTIEQYLLCAHNMGSHTVYM